MLRSLMSGEQNHQPRQPKNCIRTNSLARRAASVGQLHFYLAQHTLELLCHLTCIGTLTVLPYPFTVTLMHTLRLHLVVSQLLHLAIIITKFHSLICHKCKCNLLFRLVINTSERPNQDFSYALTASSSCNQALTSNNIDSNGSNCR